MNRWRTRVSLVSFCGALLGACTEVPGELIDAHVMRVEDASASDASDARPDPVAALDAGADAGAGDSGASRSCPRLPAPADRVRHVVVSHNFDETGGRSDQYEVLTLGEDGVISRPREYFHMGHAFDGQIVFTPDGELGFSAQTDGSIGVFRLDETGAPTVIHSAFSGDFHASSVVIDPSGEFLWILDTQWREHGGGIHRARIGCDGRLSEVERIAPAKLAYGMQFRANGHALVVSHDILDVGPGPDLFALDLGAPRVVSSGELFTDMDWIVAGFGLSANERHVFVGDNSVFSETGNRIGVAAIGEDVLRAVQIVTGVEDPISIVASPDNDAVLVTSGFGDELIVFDYDPEAEMPLSGRRTLAGSALPSTAVLIERGALRGLTIVAENVAIRRVRFEGGGVVRDLGSFSLGTGNAEIVGALGVTP